MSNPLPNSWGASGRRVLSLLLRGLVAGCAVGLWNLAGRL